MRRLLLYGLLLILTVQPVFSQKNLQPSYTISEGRMYIRLRKNIDEHMLRAFIDKYDLGDLDLAHALFSGQLTPLTNSGWHVDLDNRKELVISKPIGGMDQLGNPEKRMALTEDHPNSYDLFPPRNDDLVYGFNRFSGKFPFAVQGSDVTFYLKGHNRSDVVLLAGSFTNWQNGAIRMTRTDSGWITTVPLSEGKYWYKFIVDGNWMTDRDNNLTETDLHGNANSVYYKPNVTFTLAGHLAARDAFLTGSFCSWNPGELPMQKGPTGWSIQLYLAEGTYTYKFLVDGKPMEDPANRNRIPDRSKGYNSVFRLGQPHLFTLRGYARATSVALAGTFNGWQANEWYMQRTADGWQLPYTLGPGNYQYRFVVDGKWIVDPGNPLFVFDRQHHLANSYLIVQPNYTFRLTGYPDAQEVFLAGEFNDWTPNSLKMTRVGNTWVYNIHLSTGKHLYKFVVDGHWIKDPDNPLWEENEYNTDNSVLWMEEK